MSISQAMYTGVTGLSTNADNMSVIANNLANANSKGFKRDRAEFEDILAKDLRNGGLRSAIGRGSRLSRIKTLQTQGGMQITDNLTDVAIQGSGFFVVTNPQIDTTNASHNYYTRVGTLGFDKDGYFATHDGGRLQGYPADDKGNLSSRLGDIRIETNILPPRATDKVTLKMQLDSRVDIKPMEFDPLKPDETSNYASSLTVFDNFGRSHLTTVYFRKTNADANGSQWEWHAAVDGKEVTDPDSGPLKFFANGKIGFDKLGMLASQETVNSSVNFTGGVAQDQKVLFDFGTIAAPGAARDVNASASIAGHSSTVFHQQDGYEVGQLKSLNISKDGKVIGLFTNGVQKTLAGIALATFANEDGLEKGGNNQFLASNTSGLANIGMPESGVRGSLHSSTLEESNVDLAEQFVEMIRAQRLFQANSKTITTSDAMTEEVVALKR